MKKLMRWIFLITLLGSLFSASSQGQRNPAIVDSMKKRLANAKTIEEKVDLMGKLSMTLMSTNIPEADRYGELMGREAEISRKRDLMVKALLYNGRRYSFFSGNKAFLEKSLDYYTKALQLAKQNKLEKKTAEALLSLAGVNMSVPDLDKSMSYTTQAFAVISNLHDDSLFIAAHYSYGAVYQLRKERIQALKHYLIALQKAEEINNSTLKRSCYSILSQFYADLKDYDKAIDYSTKSSEELQFIKAENNEFTAVVDLYLLGDLYMKKKDFATAMYYYEWSIRKADSINYQPLKMPGYRGILNQFIQSKQPLKALEYLNSRDDMKKFITNFGAGHAIDNSYAIIYKQLGKYDSAGYYFEKAAPGLENTGTPSSKISFYYSYADFFNRSGNSAKAIEYYNKAMALANQTKDLEWQQDISKQMDTIYANVGDFKQSRFFSNMYHDYKDSLQKLSEEKDLLQRELAYNEQKQKRIEKENAEALERKHTVQYMGITIGIALVFLLLVIMGAFKVSETMIRIMGFFAFILLFEFIILIADTRIHHWTHGEPLPILGIKIILIAMLLPLHHWLEHRVVHYLASRRLILPSRKNIWKNLVSKKKPAEKQL